MPPAARRLAAFATADPPAGAGEPAYAATRLRILDVLGCGLAAHALGDAPYAHSVAAAAASGSASAIGVADGRDPAMAALANGIACHTLDFDDTHTASITHVSAVVLPAALAAAEHVGAPFGELLSAVLIGSEITCRVGLPTGDALARRGFHATAICGVFGATAAVGRLLGVEEDQLVNALGICGSMAGGLLAFLTDGSATKRIHPGWMAHAAHMAIALARAGASGPAAVLEGPGGIYRAFLDRADLDVPTADLGTRWESIDIAFKPYPACHLMHAALDATAQLRQQSPAPLEDIEQITVFAPQAAVDMVLAPLARKHRPATAYEAKFSAPFAIGALLVHGGVDVQTFSGSRLNDQAVLDVAARVDFEPTVYPTFPASFPGGVRFRMRDGSQLTAHVEHQRGGPASPMSGEEVRLKFRANAATALAPDEIDELERAVLRADAGDSLAPLQLLRRARAAR